ncbi:MAG: restriction endonuclease [Candidatus Limivivens sp.]|nr:restriction endonuclease [Candidatus Limivivens sp.]
MKTKDPKYPGPYGKNLTSPQGRFFKMLRKLLLPLPTIFVLIVYAAVTAVTFSVSEPQLSVFADLFSGFFRVWVIAELIYGISALIWKTAGLFFFHPAVKVLTAFLYFTAAVFLLVSGLPGIPFRLAPAASCIGAGFYTLYFLVLSARRRTDLAHLTGEEFEKYCVKVLKKNGFRRIRRIGGSGDHGIDILCRKRLKRIAIQCKCYSGSVGNSAVQQAYTGKDLYQADVAVVMTNSWMTQQAKREAAQLEVLIWDRDNFEKNEFPLK